MLPYFDYGSFAAPFDDAEQLGLDLGEEDGDDLLVVLDEVLGAAGSLGVLGRDSNFSPSRGLKKSAITGGLTLGYHLQLVVVPGSLSLGLGDEDVDLLVGLGSSHRIEIGIA